MKRSIRMVDKRLKHIHLTVLLSLLLALIACQSEQTTPRTGFHALPELIGEHLFVDGADTLVPTRLQNYYDTLFVAYQGQPFIDLYTTDFERIARVELTDPEPVNPTEFFVTDSMLVVISHARGMVILYDRRGKLINSFGTQVDGVTKLRPYSLFCYGGVAYVSDLSLQGIMAVSLTNAKDITEVGELILTIPTDTTKLIGFPSALMITVDGRLISADSKEGKIKVFTCDGRHIYDFDSLATEQLPLIHGLAYDNISDQALIDTTKFDPSNIHTHGRLHALDQNNNRVHMFSTLGKYIGSYPEDRTVLERASDITVDYRNRHILVADPAKGKLLIFSYGEE